MTESPLFEIDYGTKLEEGVLTLVGDTLSGNGLTIKLEGMEYPLMLLFMESGWNVVLHEKIRHVLFNTDTLNQTQKSDFSVAKARLQVKLDALTNRHLDIRNKKRYGYRLVIR